MDLGSWSCTSHVLITWWSIGVLVWKLRAAPPPALRPMVATKSVDWSTVRPQPPDGTPNFSMWRKWLSCGSTRGLVSVTARLNLTLDPRTQRTPYSVMNKTSAVSCLGPPPHHHHHHHHQNSLNPHRHIPTAPPPTMLPFDSLGLYEPQPKPRFYFKMPRVVPDQKNKFESDELFRRLSRESEVRYTGYRDRPLEERQMRFQNGCREGHTEIAFVATGTNLQLVFNVSTNGYAPEVKDSDFDKEPGKVHLRSLLIMNGVCVRWKGWLDLDRLDGVGCLEYDEEAAHIEDAILREQIERYNQRLRDFEEKQRTYCGQQDRTESELESRKKAEVSTGLGHGHHH